MNKLYILLLIGFSSFSFAQNLDLNKGKTQEQSYYTEIKFEYTNGKIIIPILIKDKTYHFLLDTGAPNLITKKLVEILNPKRLQEIKVSDANDNKSLMNLVELPNLTIGNVVFENSVALSSNDDNNLVYYCFNIY